MSDNLALIFSDIHVYPHKRSNERLKHCLDALDWALQTAIDRHAKFVIFCGDLFHDRHKIDVLTYQRTFEIFEKHLYSTDVAPFETFLVLGNHDIWHLEKKDISSVIPFQNLPGVTVVRQAETLSLGGIDVSFLPYTSNPIADLSEIKNDSKFKILFGHVAVDGAMMNVVAGTHSDVEVEHDGDVVKVDGGLFEDWNQVFLGHYHACQQLKDAPNVEYVGSPLQLSFGEAFTHKHIVLYDLETHDKEYIRNKFSPQHFIITPEKVERFELNKNFVRIMVDDLSKTEWVELRTNILLNNKVGSLEIKQIDKQQDEGVVEEAKSILYQGNEMLTRYVDDEAKNDRLQGLDKEKLLTIGQFICEGESNG